MAKKTRSQSKKCNNKRCGTRSTVRLGLRNPCAEPSTAHEDREAAFRCGSVATIDASPSERKPPVGKVLPATAADPIVSPWPPIARPNKERFWVTTFVDAAMLTECVTRDQVPTFDASKFQFYYNPADGTIRVVRPSGTVIEYSSAMTGVGPVSLRIPFGLMTSPGRRMSPFDLASLVGLRSLQVHQNFEQRLQAARRAFGEGGKRPDADKIHFLPSKNNPYVVWWNRAAFAVIEPESWLDHARTHMGCGPILFHYILFGEARLPAAS
jgi:hypothetical protein